MLDPILEAYVEEDQSPEEMIAAGFLPDVVHRIVNMVDGNEYKRRQSPPGIKVTPRAFGRDRRLPISQAFRRNTKPVKKLTKAAPRPGRRAQRG